MKVCIKCNLPKEDNKFAFRCKEKNIRRNVCRECCGEYTKGHYQRNKIDYLNRAKRFNKNQKEDNRKRFVEFLSGKKCVDCGNSDIRVLEFDHRSGCGKKDNVSNMIFRHSWKMILTEIEKCDIRCANCHRIKTITEFGHFKSRG